MDINYKELLGRPLLETFGTVKYKNPKNNLEIEIGEPMETVQELKQGMDESRRRDFLRDMSIASLMELIPNDDLFWDGFKEDMIDHIIYNIYDKQVNGDVR